MTTPGAGSDSAPTSLAQRWLGGRSDETRKELVLRWVMTNAAFVGLVALIVISTMLSPYFLTEQNLFNVLRQWTMVGLIAVGLTFVIISGGIDLSGGAILACGTVVGALAMSKLGAAGAIVSVVFMGAAFGYLNGAVITWGRVTPFVATLGTMTVARGAALMLSDGRTVITQTPEWFQFWFGRGFIGPVPAPVIIAGLFFVAAAIALRMTRYGRLVAMVGDNEVAAYRCGVNVPRVKRSVYVIHGVGAALAGLLFLGRLGVGEPASGALFELNGIAAVVIGGTPFTGGAGGVGLTFIGLMVIGLTYNILNLLSVSPYAQDIARGVIIVVAVMFSVRSIRARR
ncbi:ribose ABC transporter permease [Alsobacter soli]|uniref:Ribose ABC transporter permease n=1 Tax=Alsobacter soli TaxID=2109933 RepID=A0A2T1HTG4_9HYPH|nr:ABC transporter permease [Alsobacter soli]PSC04898.1 ribose ABC transporter permease [Alsobacter soli]